MSGQPNGNVNLTVSRTSSAFGSQNSDFWKSINQAPNLQGQYHVSHLLVLLPRDDHISSPSKHIQNQISYPEGRDTLISLITLPVRLDHLNSPNDHNFQPRDPHQNQYPTAHYLLPSIIHLTTQPSDHSTANPYDTPPYGGNTHSRLQNQTPLPPSQCLSPSDLEHHRRIQQHRSSGQHQIQSQPDRLILRLESPQSPFPSHYPSLRTQHQPTNY
ncbi:hypothetical protein PSTT_15415 [Puccinia striiformis]|uniref:Uncharacterized protein n=1 Tax=Puccinia striiformis TaxID=27350 RepID=A0A2S4UI61_9BASI|nr:hypothetical protein PSTT_15415 [Puccinia striiformis]